MTNFVFVCPPGVTDEVKSVSVMEGDSVTLNSNLTKICGDLIQWVFVNSLIGHINVKDDRITVFDYDDGRFRERLNLDKQTGSLTITNITTEHDGLYELHIYREAKCQKFSLSVYSELKIRSPSGTQAASETLGERLQRYQALNHMCNQSN